ncbi:MAG: sulfur oxidation c-type cytochrome SoxX [Gammaproteobacteria bacterium]|jgi:sulfur-oxidizing protein SoxX|nr:sulfur oxidation c-type cytochrome SoxX [Gammaproteobacteria bacterium]MDH3935483.1 sulfur oxidation c-type cytochrome SoxX [Gammaproteobacteria bacterium]MDH3970991.1 sulfur oxidation c-type cytochrome SoxX [Gammaproteobacteria bacterium]MDH3984829.1 sulfur oxidation c-type cytochrome SoxX [Gammaproteobacteria bacterium]
MRYCRISLLSGILLLQLALLTGSGIATAREQALPDDYCQWAVTDYAIAQPLCELAGDASRGMAIALDSGRGNCLACHQLPIPDVEAYGTIGPPLSGIGARLTKGQIRLRVVDTREINPMSIMPGFYRDPRLIHRPDKRYAGRTFLNAQQVEDVIAYLVTLK